MRTTFGVLLIGAMALLGCNQPAPAPPPPPAPTAIPTVPSAVSTPVPIPTVVPAVVVCKALGIGPSGVVWQGDCVDNSGPGSCQPVSGGMFQGDCKSRVGPTINRLKKAKK